jgi:RNase P/RNase MRP subunit p29
MDRKLLITIHLYLSAFFAPAVILVAVSGGLYLVGIKGNVEQETVYQSADATIDSSSISLKADVTALLSTAGAGSYDFEYVKVKGTNLYTRPTSSEHYIIKLNTEGLEVIHAQPSLQNRLVELHKGHGPTAFKTFQKAFAVGLLFIILSGLWLGISSTRLRMPTSLALGAGAIIMGLLLV